MKRFALSASFFPLVLVAIIVATNALSDEPSYDRNPPFTPDLLAPAKMALAPAGGPKLFNPRNLYNIFINYELGMHCVGFDISYCCIIPPYNSVQAQAIRSGIKGGLPQLLSPDDNVRFYYSIRDNSYSEGNKMKYWQVPKDVSGEGTMNNPGDNIANYVWTHLFIYKDLEGTMPEKPLAAKRLHIGRDIPVNIDSGPSGKSVAGGYLDYSKKGGGNIVFTDSLIPEVRDVPLRLTSSYLWDALGLPLTAFNDSARKGTIRSVREEDFQPYQYAVVQMRDDSGKPVITGGKAVEFFGTEPIDIANCMVCHAGEGRAAKLSRESGLSLFDKEYEYWKKNYADVSDYMAHVSAASINILELHDKKHKTDFLKHYDPNAASNRIGKTGPVNCVDCHGDNISGNLQSPRPGATGYKAVKSKPLSEAIHAVHASYIPMPDKAGRAQSCQTCHPTHWQDSEMNDPNKNPYQILDQHGNARFTNSDLRISGGGCYLRRDAHANPRVKPPFFLNEIGKWYLAEVSRKDELGKHVAELRGLYCTNCHNHLSHELYRHDDISSAATQEGTTLRNKAVSEIIATVAGGDTKRFRDYFADPVVGAGGNPLLAYYADHKSMVMARSTKSSDGKIDILPWNDKKGEAVPYEAASAGKDWWLSPGEPHCADCHAAPFVESDGGKYFPIDQPGKYSLYRYSKAHGELACQSCHESAHGLYPVRYEGPGKTVDMTSHEQALQFSPDGKYAGPVTCGACHTINSKGVPVQLTGTEYENDYWASTVLIHFMREGDQKMPIDKLTNRFPYRKSHEVVVKGWE